MPPDDNTNTQTDLFSVFADMPYRDADAFDFLHRDNEAEDPQHLTPKSPAQALEAIYNRNLDLAAEGIDIEALAPDVALRHARNDQADFMLLGENEKMEAVRVIADNFRNRAYSTEFARNNQEAAQYIIQEISILDKPLGQMMNSMPGGRMVYNDKPGIAGAEIVKNDGTRISFGGREAIETFAADNNLSAEDKQKLLELDARADQFRSIANGGSARDALAIASIEAEQARIHEIDMDIRANPDSTMEAIVATRTEARNSTTPSAQAQRRELMNELKELDRVAVPGYSPLKSWENLRETARTNGLSASIQRGGDGENSPPYVITYTDAEGKVTPIQSELHQNGKAVTTVAGERVPGTAPTPDKVWQQEALTQGIIRYRLEAIKKETEQIQATPGFRIMEARREDEFRKAEQTLESNATDALKIRMLQDSKGQHNVAVQRGDDIRSYEKYSSIHSANLALKNLRDMLFHKTFGRADFEVLPKLLTRRAKASGRTIYDQAPAPSNQLRDSSPGSLRDDGAGYQENFEFDGKRVLKTHELPAKFRKKFIVSDDVPGKFYFPDSKKLAFSDHGGKLATDENKPEVVRSMIELAKEKNWSSITLSGTDEFKREAWLQASLEGMEVKGYKPKPEDIALLDQAREQRMANRLYQAPGNPKTGPSAPQNEISATPQVPPPSQEGIQPQIQHQRITLSVPNGSQVPPEVLKVIETALARPVPPNTEQQAFKVPDDYKPSPDALAVAEKMRAGGVPEEKMRLVMYGVDMSKQAALEKGIPEFQARIFDPSVAPQKNVSIAAGKPATPTPQTPQTPQQDITQPTHSPRR